MSAKKKAAPRAVASARRAKIAYEPEIPLVRIDAMELALIRHIYSGEILECEPLSTQDAKEIKKAILLLKLLCSYHDHIVLFIPKGSLDAEVGDESGVDLSDTCE